MTYKGHISFARLVHPAGERYETFFHTIYHSDIWMNSWYIWRCLSSVQSARLPVSTQREPFSHEWYSIFTEAMELKVFSRLSRDVQVVEFGQGMITAGRVCWSKEVQIVYRLFLVNCYLLHVPRLPSQPAGSGRGWVIDFIWLELPWQYIAMTRDNLNLNLISLCWSLHKVCNDQQTRLAVIIPWPNLPMSFMQHARAVRAGNALKT